jgi:hypothetical protein
MPNYSNILHTQFMNLWEKLVATDTSQFKPESSTTAGEMYFIIIEPDLYTKVDIQFVPEVLNYNRVANMQEVRPILRNIPKLHYSGGTTNMTFRLDFFAQQEDRKDVIEKVRLLESTAHSDGYDAPKPQVKIVWGELFRDEIWEVSSVRAQLSNFKAEQGFLPQQAYVDITVIRVSDSNLTFADIR